MKEINKEICDLSERGLHIFGKRETRGETSSSSNNGTEVGTSGYFSTSLISKETVTPREMAAKPLTPHDYMLQHMKSMPRLSLTTSTMTTSSSTKSNTILNTATGHPPHPPNQAAAHSSSSSSASASDTLMQNSTIATSSQTKIIKKCKRTRINEESDDDNNSKVDDVDNAVENDDEETGDEDCWPIKEKRITDKVSNRHQRINYLFLL